MSLRPAFKPGVSTPLPTEDEQIGQRLEKLDEEELRRILKLLFHRRSVSYKEILELVDHVETLTMEAKLEDKIDQGYQHFISYINSNLADIKVINPGIYETFTRLGDRIAFCEEIKHRPNILYPTKVYLQSLISSNYRGSEIKYRQSLATAIKLISELEQQAAQLIALSAK